jgi:poly-gamma-glutamate system protein
MTSNCRKPSDAPVYAAGALSLLFILVMTVHPARETSLRREMLEASRLMARAETAVRDCRTEKGVAADDRADPNRTGLIGLAMSPITTSLGNVAAKRTTANPAFAALMVSLLDEAGVRREDTVALGASSSFPALIIAALSAAKVMGLNPVVISSLGASEWGANNPAFNWLDMGGCLRTAGILDFRPVALAVGGDEDVGRDMSPAGRALLAAQIAESGVFFIEKPDLEANVRERLRLYETGAGGRPIRAFINIGGSWANIGTNAKVLKLKPGLLGDVFNPAPNERGVLQAMAARKIPVIHLLNIRGLCARYGLPWDPRPLPKPGEGEIYGRAAGRGRLSVILSGVYMAFLAVLYGMLRGRALADPSAISSPDGVQYRHKGAKQGPS